MDITTELHETGEVDGFKFKDRTTSMSAKPLLTKNVALALIVAISCVVLLLLSNDRWWRKLNGARITYNGHEVPAAEVYRSPTGELLLNLQLSGERSLFVIYPAEKRVGMPNERHFFLLPGYAFSRYVPPLVVFMDDPVKGGWDLQLQVTANSIEFSSGGRIRIVTE